MTSKGRKKENKKWNLFRLKWRNQFFHSLLLDMRTKFQKCIDAQANKQPIEKSPERTLFLFNITKRTKNAKLLIKIKKKRSTSMSEVWFLLLGILNPFSVRWRKKKRKSARIHRLNFKGTHFISSGVCHYYSQQQFLSHGHHTHLFLASFSRTPMAYQTADFWMFLTCSPHLNVWCCCCCRLQTTQWENERNKSRMARRKNKRYNER